MLSRPFQKMFVIDKEANEMATEGHRKFWEEFILLYRNLPCLWNFKIKEYTDKNLRNAALEKLVVKCKQINPMANKDFVTKKIHNFRCSFRREYKKMNESKISGIKNEVYTPSLWYFGILSFIIDSELAKPCSDSSELDEVFKEDEEVDVKTKINDLPNEKKPLTFNPVIVNLGKRKNPDFELREGERNESQDEKNNFEQVEEELVNLAAKPPLHRLMAEDQFDIAGKKFAYDLREINDRQRIYAEKLISEVIYNAKLGLLHEYSIVNVNPLQNVHNIMQADLH